MSKLVCITAAAGAGKTSAIVGRKDKRHGLGQTHDRDLPSLMGSYGWRELEPIPKLPFEGDRSKPHHPRVCVVEIGDRNLLFPWNLDGHTNKPGIAVAIMKLLERGNVITDRLFDQALLTQIASGKHSTMGIYLDTPYDVRVARIRNRAANDTKKTKRHTPEEWARRGEGAYERLQEMGLEYQIARYPNEVRDIAIILEREGLV